MWYWYITGYNTSYNILGGWGRLDQGKQMIITFRIPSKLATPVDNGIDWLPIAGMFP